MSTKQSVARGSTPDGRQLGAPSGYRKLMSKRLREIDRRGKRELEQMLADARRIKAAFLRSGNSIRR